MKSLEMDLKCIDIYHFEIIIWQLEIWFLETLQLTVQTVPTVRELSENTYLCW